MYNFYQTALWREISEQCYEKPSVSVFLFGKEYFGVIKEKKFGPWNFQRYQILGVDLEPTAEILNSVNEQLRKQLQKDSFDLFVQVGRTYPIGVFPSQSGDVQAIVSKQLATKAWFSNFGWMESKSQNLPPATVQLDLTGGYENQQKQYHKSVREKIKKAQKVGLSFRRAEKNERTVFYEMRKRTATGKGFSVIPIKHFENLKNYLLDQKMGELFLAIDSDGQIVAGNICLFDGKTIVYLYGAADRAFGNIGGDQFLKDQIIKRACENSFELFELLGAGPTGDESHHLAGVGLAKERLGGQKIDYLGSFDLPFNKLLNWIYRWM